MCGWTQRREPVEDVDRLTLNNYSRELQILSYWELFVGIIVNIGAVREQTKHKNSELCEAPEPTREMSNGQ